MGHDFEEGKTILDRYPFKFRIEPTNHCNLKCKLCVQSNWLKGRKKGFMKWNLFKKIVDEIEGKTKFIGLFNAGEPLFHPRIVEFVKLSSDRGLRPYFHTNGVLLTEKLTRKLINAGLDYISFSIDGNKKEYESNRGFDYDLLKNNILDFLRVKKELRSKIPFTVIQVFKNRPEIKDIFKDADQINVIDKHNWGGLVDVKINRDTESCKALWEYMAIGWDGKVSLCCIDLTNKVLMGDVSKDSVFSIWNNKKFQRFREMILKGEMPNFCKECYKNPHPR